MLNQKSYFFQYSKTNDSICRGCNNAIPQDEMRVYRNDHFEIYPYPTNGWFHLQCFWMLEEVKKNIHENDVMLEIEDRERNYENEYWQYQKHKIIKNYTQFSLHDGQNSCFYTSLAFFDSTNSKIILRIDEMDLLEIRKKIAEIKDSINTASVSSPTRYASAEDVATDSEKPQNLIEVKYSINNSSVSSPSTYSSAEDVTANLQKHTNLVEIKDSMNTSVSSSTSSGYVSAEDLSDSICSCAN
uniref:PARP-type domain-containing protein n=1 Tax=Panagrolaimus sp. ES5 TaxID=591445 RepID=A0AC34FG46_9BILA